MQQLLGLNAIVECLRTRQESAQDIERFRLATRPRQGPRQMELDRPIVRRLPQRRLQGIERRRGITGLQQDDAERIEDGG